MTTPGGQGTGGGITRNQLSMTQAAAGAFETAVSDLQQIYNQVTEANVSLAGAMVSESSTTWQRGTAQWSDDFYKLKQSLQNIKEMLDQQVAQMQANEARNVELTGGQSG